MSKVIGKWKCPQCGYICSSSIGSINRHLKVCKNPLGLHDAGIEPSGQGEDAAKSLTPAEIIDQYKPNHEYNSYYHESYIEQMMEQFAAQQTALLSRQLLRSEQKNQAKDEEIQRLREALEWYADDGNYCSDLPNGRIQLATAYQSTINITRKAKSALKPSSKTTKEGV